MTIAKEQRTVEKHKVYITESPDKPLMALIRMAAGGMGLWDKVWPFLTEYFTVASIDLPAPALDKFDSTSELFKHVGGNVIKVTQGLGYDKFHIFGWTGGAQVALRCLVDFPDHILSAILMGAVDLPEERRPLEKSSEILKVILDHGDLELYTYFWLLSQHTPGYTEEHFDRIQALVDARLKADRGRLDTQRVLKWIKAIRQQVASDEELAAINVPTLLVAPAFEAFPLLAHVRRLQTKIKTSEMALIPGGGSMVLSEAPDKFMAAAGKFIRAVAKGNPPLAKLSEKNTVTIIQNKKRVDALENASHEALVFLHGWLMSPQMWAHAMAALKGKMRCLALWQPGHGKSTAPDYDFTMEQWVDWLIGTLEAMNIKKFVLAGHSMGGMLTLAFTLKYPEKVKGIVLVDTQDQAWETEKSEEFLQAVDTVAAAWSADLAPQVADFLMGKNFLKKEPAWVGTWANEVAKYDLPGIANLGRTICQREDLSGRVGEIRVPALVVHGTIDEAIDIEIGRAMAKRIPGARFEEMPGAAHCPPWEAPELFAAKLLDFLKTNNFIQ
ncbi:MAG: alpha/beta hydrolase [Deltaproteobacteria bacterium]|nr:alpha/beta hydrolase [Deltaproteobacteria bacterium]MBW2086334.1 alpha/beta hydrolase [Deltaproteobacteria bacterium]